jgi:glycosyltransferase involved in cell wall biosynthesis
MLREKAQLRSPLVRPVFLTTARLIPLKNLTSLIYAAEMLRTWNYQFEVWIVGDGPLRDELSQLRDALGLRGYVHLLPAVNYRSIGLIYSTADVFVMPSWNDYRSMAVLEAMQFGLPVIDSSGDGNAGDAVKSHVNGFTFEPGSVESLAHCMQAFILDDSLAATFGMASKQIIDSLAQPRPAEVVRTLLNRSRES